MSALDNYRIHASQYRCESLHQEFNYSCDSQRYKQEDFRRARSCDNILDGEWRGTSWGNKRSEKAWGHNIGSTRNKERLIYGSTL